MKESEFWLECAVRFQRLPLTGNDASPVVTWAHNVMMSERWCRRATRHYEWFSRPITELGTRADRTMAFYLLAAIAADCERA